MKRIQNNPHLDFIRGLPCIICGDNTSTEAAHIRYSDSRAGKINPGVGAKPHDRFTLPLCGNHHRAQHATGEREYWAGLGLDPIFYALALYGASGDQETAERIIAEAQHGG